MNVLVAEDEVAIRDLLEINLSLAGYNVFTAKDGEEARNIFEKEKIDLVLLDVMMPKIDGFELIKYIKMFL
jgi:DNA-binding response OmpR family regulator